MQISKRDGAIILDGNQVTVLDTFVASVVRIIEACTEYVIVSGYVAILFGRARGTEDIDLIIRDGALVASGRGTYFTAPPK